GYAGLATSKASGARSAAVFTGTNPPPNSRKIRTKIPSVTPSLRRKDRKVFIVSAPGRVYVRLRPGVQRSEPVSGGSRRKGEGVEDPSAVARNPDRRARGSGSGVEVQRVLVRMRPEPQRAHLVRHLVLDPGLHDVRGENVALEQEVVIALEVRERLVERARH